ncbi:MAG: hypothetical protein ACYCS1_04335 [Gammaproteobacteria bacterium]
MSKYVILVFLMAGIITMASAESVSQLPSPNGNSSILQYNIQLNKSANVGIFSFSLTGTYNAINESNQDSYANCTITNNISCNAIFIATPGQYNNMEVFINGQFYENITLPIPISNTPPQNSTLHIVANYSVYYSIIEAIILLFVAGNVVYLILHRKDLNKFSQGLKI